MNTDKDCHGVPMNKNVIITVFHRSHLYYGAGVLCSVVPEMRSSPYVDIHL